MPFRLHRPARAPRICAAAAALALVSALLLAGEPDAAQNQPPDQSSQSLPRADWGYQATVITQTAPSFRDPYEGPRSFRNEGSTRASTTLTLTLFGAASLWRHAWISVQPEFAGGQGVGGVQGIAAYVNQDAVRAATNTSQKPYLARAFITQGIALGAPAAQPAQADSKSGGEEGHDAEAFQPGDNPLLGLTTTQPRIEITIGKIALPDFYDSNDVAGDAHHRLMNWALVTDGAWDYAADTRGYTWGVTVAALRSPLALRFGSYAMPREANGVQFDQHLSRAHAEDVELAWTFDDERSGVVRLLAYVNHARMGSYEQALASTGVAPDITATRREGRRKSGVGANVQRMFSESWGAFLRAGWNDGKTESFAYTEIDRTVSAGISCSGSFWHRPDDQIVVAGVVSGLSGPHRRYLEAGGVGFQIGDGRLRYGREEVLEADYNAAVTKTVAIGLDFQRVGHPGYNADRGPIVVYGLRLHVHR